MVASSASVTRGYHGSLPQLLKKTHKRLAAPIVGISTSPSVNGYWLAGRDGGVFAFGRATFWGSLPEYRDRQQAPPDQKAPVAALAGTPDGSGYWVMLTSGHIYAFNDAAKWPQVPAERQGEYDSMAAAR